MPRSFALLAFGFVVAVGGPWLLWTRLVAGLARGTATHAETLAFGGAALFACGWCILGASFASPGRRLVVLARAAALYAATGVGWVLAFNVAVGTKLEAFFREPAALLALTLAWPLQVAQLVGLFGLSFD